MADLGNRNWLVKPTTDVEKKWIECQIQEKKSKIVRLKQDIEDLKKGKIIALEAEIMMINKELDSLNEKYGEVEQTLDI